MNISLSPGLPPDVIHSLQSLFYMENHDANSTSLMLAMQDAPCHFPLGDLLVLSQSAPRRSAMLPRLRLARHGYNDALRTLFTKAAALATTALRDGLLSAVKRAGTGVKI